MTPTIYRIEFPDGQFYLGATVNFAERRRTHLRHARKAKSVNSRLQKAFDAYPVCGVYEVACGFSRDDLHLLEEQLIAQERPPLNVNTAPSPLPPTYTGSNKAWGPYKCLRDAAINLGVSYQAAKKTARRYTYEEFLASRKQPPVRMYGPPDPRKRSPLIRLHDGWHKRKDVCLVTGDTARDRIRRGWNHDAAYTTPAGQPNPTTPDKVNISSVCRRYGVDPTTYFQRRRIGWTTLQALGLQQRPEPRKPKVKKVLLTVDGKTRTLDGWAKELGVTTAVLHARRSAKWTDRQVVGIDPNPQQLRVAKTKARQNAERAARVKVRTVPPKPERPSVKTYTVAGITGTIEQLAEHFGVTPALANGRRLKRWAPEHWFLPPRTAVAPQLYIKGVLQENAGLTCPWYYKSPIPANLLTP